MTEHVLDLGTLARLADELASPDDAARIAHLYRDGLTSRVDRLDTAFAARDAEAAMEAVLSLKVTSAMIGAVAMQRCAEMVEAEMVENDLLRGDPAAARDAIAKVRAITVRTLSALDAHLGQD